MSAPNFIENFRARLEALKDGMTVKQYREANAALVAAEAEVRAFGQRLIEGQVAGVNDRAAQVAANAVNIRSAYDVLLQQAAGHAVSGAELRGKMGQLLRQRQETVGALAQLREEARAVFTLEPMTVASEHYARFPELRLARPWLPPL